MSVALGAVVLLAGVHVLSPALTALDRVPRSRWLSFGGGVAVTLVFLEILPELARSQQEVDQTVRGGLALLDRHVYLLSLLALTLFYVIQGIVKRSRGRQCAATGQDSSGPAAFRLKLGVVAAKNVIVGYLLVREPRPLIGLLLFVVAIGLEFTISDRGMHADHKQDYDRLGRWVLAVAVVAGALVGSSTRVPDLVLSLLSAALAGFIVLNVFSEELPQDRQSSPGAFTAGVVVYATLQLAL